MDAARALIDGSGPIDGWSGGDLDDGFDALDLKPLFGVWIGIAARIAKRAGPEPLSAELNRAIYNRLARISTFFILDPEERGAAHDLWSRAEPDRVLPFVSNERRARNVATFLASQPTTAGTIAIAEGVAKRFRGEVPAWTQHILALHARGSASDLELARFAGSIPLVKSQMEPVCRRLIEREAYSALGEIAERRPSAASKAMEAIAAAAVAAGTPWLAERDNATLVDHGLAALATRSGPRAAAAIGDKSLALARSVAALGGAPDQRVEVAKRLAEQGYRIAAASLIASVRTETEAAAFRWAKLSAQGPAETRSSEPWAIAHAAWPSRRIRNAYASALAFADLDYSRAEAFLAESIAEAPGEIDAWKRLAAIKTIAGDRAAEKALLDDIVARFPDDAWAAAQHLRFDLARADVDAVGEALASLDSSSNPHQMRIAAEIHLMRGDVTTSAEAWREVAARRGMAADAYRYTVALFQENRFDEAAAELERLIVRYPGMWKLHRKLGQARERTGEFAAALDCFTRALALEPDLVDVQAGIGRCLTYTGRHDDCATWLSRLDDESVDQGWVHSLRAFNAAMAGRRGEASAALAQLHGIADTFLAQRAAAQAADPATVWKDGRFARHPHPDAGAHNLAFRDGLAMLQGAKSLALVGNAPALIGSGDGAGIDARDCVIRINDFQTDGFEADVGGRTSLWYSAAARTARPRNMLTATPTWVYQEKSYELPLIGDFSRLRLGRELDLPDACLLPPDIHYLSSRLICPWPTSGLRLIGLLEFLVQRPYALYGFEFFREQRMHYYEADNRHLHLGEFHPIQFERDFIETVLAEGSNLIRA